MTWVLQVGRAYLAFAPHGSLRLIAALAALGFSSTVLADTVRVAVAANFVGTLRALAEDFEAYSGHRLALSAGSTGKLYAQILNGAPYDVFLAADETRPRALVAAGRADPTQCFTYASGRLALWTPESGLDPERMLHDGQISTLAIANPTLAPYGAAAIQALTESGAPKPPRIVRGESVGQAMTFVKTRGANAGFVSLAQVLALPSAARGSWWLPPVDSYTPITQDAVVLRETQGSLAFAAWLTSEQTQRALAKRGYLAVPTRSGE